ncbi:protein MAINTENANCE OF MERISTEMS-like [Arachis hypogaea]|uniref:protein MAINTENANCE OF MERISTEMS-like n=1 Tax=Arachis hypogaea TaxID=3818 RepID=UPI003B21A390
MRAKLMEVKCNEGSVRWQCKADSAADEAFRGDECGIRPRLLLPRRVSHTLPPSDAIVLYLVEAGFGDTVPFRDFTFDNSLITAFVEQWHPETHTFHLPWDEATITLQDVLYHLGLRAHRDPVGCLRDFGRWYHTEQLVERLLGAGPPVAPQ